MADKSTAPRRLEEKGDSYEEKIDIPAAGSIRRKKQELTGNGALRLGRAQRHGGDLAVRGGAGDADVSSWDGEGAAGRNCLVKSGRFDNE